MTTSTFETKTYNGVSIIVNTANGYVNASQICSANNKKWRNYKNTKQWKQVVEAFQRRFSQGAQNWAPSIYEEKVKPEFQGEYVHPKLVHFVAEYCSVDYAFAVAELMDNINNKVHEELKEKQLQDTVENAKPIFKKVVNEIIVPNNEAYEQQYAWGVRDNSMLGYWEREELYSDIKAYNNLKEQFAKAQEKINSWNTNVEEYFPGLMN